MKFRTLISVFAALALLSGCKHHHRAPNGFAAVAQQAPMTLPGLPDVSGQAIKISNIYYTQRSPRSNMQTLDLYLPTDPAVKKPYKVIVWIHGGSWLGGDKNVDCLPARLYSNRYAVASINYRFTNEVTFPGQIHDCKAAIRFLRGNAKKYHLDPEHIAVWGESAGGYLAAMLGTSGGVKALEGSSGWNKYSSNVTAAVDWCGPTDLNTAQSQAGPNNKIRFDNPGSAVYNLMGGRMDKESLASGSPVTYASKDDPPFLIMHGDQDDAIPPAQSQELYDRLKEQGVDATYHLLKGWGHGFAAPDHLKYVEEFLDRTMSKPESR
jgi:acetyl esterase/lipase